MTDECLPFHEAFALAGSLPDPPGLDNIVMNNGGARRTQDKVRTLAKCICVMCPRLGARFYLGSARVADQFGEHQQTVLRWMWALEEFGVIRREWTGGLCRRDEDGHEYPRRNVKVKDRKGGNRFYAARASEYTFVGLPAEPTRTIRRRKN